MALEWSVRVADGSSEILTPESGRMHKAWLGLQRLILGLLLKPWRFLKKAWNLGVDEPKKVIHCVKVGVALTVVSLFYYMRPLYDGVGGNAMWAVMTVVVVFEYTVGATLCKCLNRASGTFLAGSLAMGVHWIASQSGKKLEPFILGTSVFLLASAATFSRFIPSVKAKFDYGAMIFILTFSLVSVSGFRVEQIFELAHHRLTTIAIGTSMCILISMLVCPVWAGEELHLLINRNMGKLADSLDGFAAEYFKESGGAMDSKEECHKKSQGYKCVLNSKATEDAFANLARWEPAHGLFNFRHPWKQYLKIAASIRNCACCIETINGCMNSEFQAPEFLKKHLSNVCIKLSSYASNVLKEVATTTTTMTKSSKTDFSVIEMNGGVEELRQALKSLPNHLTTPPLLVVEAPENEGRDTPLTAPINVQLMEVAPLVTVASLLIEIIARIEGIVDTVDELAELAEFKPAVDEKEKQDQPTNKLASENQDKEPMKPIQLV